MEIRVKRKNFTDVSTISEVYIDGVWECYMIEDKDRQRQENGVIFSWSKDLKIERKTAIPYGKYEVAITFSGRFQKPLPLLMNVPNFEGIRIHSGNTAEDTEGCLLPGTHKNINMVINSRVAFNALFKKIKEALKKEKVYVVIEPYSEVKFSDM